MRQGRVRKGELERRVRKGDERESTKGRVRKGVDGDGGTYVDGYDYGNG